MNATIFARITHLSFLTLVLATLFTRGLPRRMFTYLSVGCFTFALVALEAVADWEYGEQRFVRNYERTINRLETRPTGRVGLNRYSVVGRIGGISFESVAQLSSDLTDEAIKLDYLPKNPDGERFQIKIGSKTITPKLYDWQLVPIANFADSRYTGVISLFGEGPDLDRYFYIDYHPALEDTLLGIRLLHADIMLIDPTGFWDLPKRDGEIILGPGETAPDPAAAKNAANHLKEILEEFNIQSWVFTDVDEPGTVTAEDGAINIEVKPYFFFWRNPNIGQRYEIAYRISFIEALIEATKAYGTPADVAELERRLIMLTKQMGDYEPVVESIDKAIMALRTDRELLRKLNPAVFDAADKTAQFAALFRMVKKNDPSHWKEFVKEIRAVDIPVYETPNQWEKPYLE